MKQILCLLKYLVWGGLAVFIGGCYAIHRDNFGLVDYDPVEYVGRSSEMRKWTSAQIEGHILQQTEYHKVEAALLVLVYKMVHDTELEGRNAIEAYMRIYWKLWDGWIEELRPTFLMPSALIIGASGRHGVSLVTNPEEFGSFWVRRISLLKGELYGVGRKNPEREFLREAHERMPELTPKEIDLNVKGVLSSKNIGYYPE